MYFAPRSWSPVVVSPSGITWRITSGMSGSLLIQRGSSRSFQNPIGARKYPMSAVSQLLMNTSICAWPSETPAWLNEVSAESRIRLLSW